MTHTAVSYSLLLLARKPFFPGEWKVVRAIINEFFLLKGERV